MAEETIIDNEMMRWHHFDDPEDPELVVLAAHYSLHELAIEDCVSRNARVKLDDYGSYLFAILSVLIFDSKSDELQDQKIGVFIGHNFLVTVCHGSNRSVNYVRARLATGESRHSPIEVFHRLTDHVCDQFLPVIDTISDEIAEMEQLVHDKPDQAISRKAISLKAALSMTRRFAVAHREVVNALLRKHPPVLDTQLTLYFRDIYDHIVHATELIEMHRELLTGLIDLNLSATAHRTNEIVKMLTIYATILLPLNVITGYFGMNFDQLPFIHDHMAVPLVTLVLIFIALASTLFFRGRNW
jgi:magnesium transporter